MGQHGPCDDSIPCTIIVDHDVGVESKSGNAVWRMKANRVVPKSGDPKYVHKTLQSSTMNTTVVVCDLDSVLVAATCHACMLHNRVVESVEAVVRPQ